MNILELLDEILEHCILVYPVLDWVSVTVCRFVCKKFNRLVIWKQLKICNIAEKGYLNVLKWAIDQGAEIDNEGWTQEYAARGGHIHILEYFKTLQLRL